MLFPVTCLCFIVAICYVWIITLDYWFEGCCGVFWLSVVFALVSFECCLFDCGFAGYCLGLLAVFMVIY